MLNDLEALKNLYMKDYRGYSIRGDLETLDMILEFYTPGTVKLDRYEVEGREVEVFRDLGIITGTGYISGHYEKHKFEHNICFTDIYLKRDGKWKCYRSQVTEIFNDLNNCND